MTGWRPPPLRRVRCPLRAGSFRTRQGFGCGLRPTDRPQGARSDRPSYALDVIKRRGERIEVEGVETNAESSLVHQGKNVLPTVKLTFTTPDKDVVSVEISAYEASKLADEMIISLKTALPKIPRRR